MARETKHKSCGMQNVGKKMQHLEREITPQKCACTDFNHLFVKMIFDKVRIGTNLGIYFQLSV